MNELTKKKQESSFAGVTIFADHYYSNSFKGFEEGYVIEWHPQAKEDDKRMLERLFTYACKTSYQATKDEEGGWTKPSKDGSHTPRCKGEIFFDVFTGKLGELALYRFLLKNGYIIEEPNIDEPRGYNNSDSFDLEWNGKNISVKTTTEKGNLLLLQTKQYDELGRYQPNVKKNISPSYFDYHVLCKYRDADSADVSHEIAFSKKDFLSEDEQERLKQILLNRVWQVGIMGFISNEELVEKVVRIGHIIPGDTKQQRTCFGKKYNKTTRVDVDNYYVQAGDMHDIIMLVNSEKKTG